MYASLPGVADGPELESLNQAATYTYPGITITYPGITMPAVMTAEAAFNHVWISCLLG